MKKSQETSNAGDGEPGTPGEPSAALAGSSSRRYGVEERKALLDELAHSGETMAAFCARRRVSTATICAWRRRLQAEGESGLVAREPRRNPSGKSGRQRSPEERRLCVEAYQRSGLGIDAFARTYGLSAWTLRCWLERYRAAGPRGLEPRTRGRKPGTSGGFKSLSPGVQAEIVRTQSRFPDFGLKKVRDFLRRFQGVEVSTGTVARTLDQAGVVRRSPAKRRPKKRPQVRRFERARPGELWQSDITSFVLSRHSTRVYLTVFLDDYSRFVVSFALSTHQRQELVTEALMDGISRFGKPKEVLTDQGRQYFAWRGKSDFQKLLDREGIRHVVSRTHHPETLGKCERLWETVGREFWERARPQDLSDARERIAHFIAHYNFFRPHQGIGGLVPADRYFGAESALRKTLEAAMSRRELDAALGEAPRKSVYLFGQVGDEQVALSGERGELVMHTSGGVEKRIGLMELGAPSAARKETSDGDEHERSGRRTDASTDAGHEWEAAPADGQETAEVWPSPAVSTRSERALDAGLARGAGRGAPLVHADPGPVAGEEAARGGGEGTLDPEPARLAAQPAGALGHDGGTLAPAQSTASEAGADHGSEGRGSACLEEEDRRARERARESPGPDSIALESAQAEERAAGVGEADLGGENESAASWSEE